MPISPQNANELGKVFIYESLPCSPIDYPQGGFWLDKQDGKFVWSNTKCLTTGCHNQKALRISTGSLVKALIRLSKTFKRYKYLDFDRVRRPIDKQIVIFGTPGLSMLQVVMSSSPWDLTTTASCAKLKAVPKDTFICWDGYPEENGLLSCNSQHAALAVWNIPYVIMNTKRRQPKTFDLIKG